jgi:CheY-like chemotaxis protein
VNQKILIVEDDEDNRTLLAKLLESQGYDVYEAGDGGEAIELAGSKLPDLVLMDMGLPLVSGYDATRTIKSNPELQKIPIVALTAATSQSHMIYSTSSSVSKNTLITVGTAIQSILDRLQPLPYY